MDKRLLPLLCCPVTRGALSLEVITEKKSGPGESGGQLVSEGILFAAEDWCYPIVQGIPRLNVEAFWDHEDFLRLHLPDYAVRKRSLEQRYAGLLAYVKKKNKKTKESFALEWSLHDYSRDRTWIAGEEELLQRFLNETGETAAGLAGKLVFDAGCGNGQLDTCIARTGATVIAMDLSNSVERAYAYNDHPNAWFIQGDIQFPPLAPGICDVLQCSGVLHHTNNSELSFSCLEPCIRAGGTYSIWLYHPRKETGHQLINAIRRVTSRWPARLNYHLLRFTALPVSYLLHRLKGRPQNSREIMIALMDWFSPEFRREHTPDEVRTWFAKRGYRELRVTTSEHFGFNFIGKKSGTAI